MRTVFKRGKNEIEVKIKKICSRFSATGSHQIDFTAYGFHKDHPPTWKLRSELLAPLGRLYEANNNF